MMNHSSCLSANLYIADLLKGCKPETPLRNINSDSVI